MDVYCIQNIQNGTWTVVVVEKMQTNREVGKNRPFSTHAHTFQPGSIEKNWLNAWLTANNSHFVWCVCMCAFQSCIHISLRIANRHTDWIHTRPGFDPRPTWLDTTIEQTWNFWLRSNDDDTVDVVENHFNSRGSVYIPILVCCTDYPVPFPSLSLCGSFRRLTDFSQSICDKF